METFQILGQILRKFGQLFLENMRLAHVLFVFLFYLSNLETACFIHRLTVVLLKQNESLIQPPYCTLF